MTDADMEKSLRRREDIDEIATALALIARAADRFDREFLVQLIDPEAVLDMGGSPMSAEQFVTVMTPPEIPRAGRLHFVTNDQVVIDGDAAWSESYIVSSQAVGADGDRKTRFRSGRYLDRWKRTAAGWKLAGRTLVDEWGRIDSVGVTVKTG